VIPPTFRSTMYWPCSSLETRIATEPDEPADESSAGEVHPKQHSGNVRSSRPQAAGRSGSARLSRVASRTPLRPRAWPGRGPEQAGRHPERHRPDGSRLRQRIMGRARSCPLCAAESVLGPAAVVGPPITLMSGAVGSRRPRGRRPPPGRWSNQVSATWAMRVPRLRAIPATTSATARSARSGGRRSAPGSGLSHRRFETTAGSEGRSDSANAAGVKHLGFAPRGEHSQAASREDAPAHREMTERARVRPRPYGCAPATTSSVVRAAATASRT
jgi:hypothetical protein